MPAEIQAGQTLLQQHGYVVFSLVALLVLCGLIVALGSLTNWGRDLTASTGNTASGSQAEPSIAAVAALPDTEGTPTTATETETSDVLPTTTAVPNEDALFSTSEPVDLPATFTSPPPTDTPLPTTTPAPVALVNVDLLNVRAGPSVEYLALALAVDGDEYTVVGRVEDNSWWALCCFEGNIGWVIADGVLIEGDAEVVPVMTDFPPLPTPEP